MDVGNAPQTAACGVLTGSARPKVGVWINDRVYVSNGVLPGRAAVLGRAGVRDEEGVSRAVDGAGGGAGGVYGAHALQCGLMDWKHETKRAEELTMAAVEDSAGANLVDGGGGGA
ncbi:hypothetical protein SASPL_155681 [Salvia splendens]|uniref:Uncharacterized protein n=1 Tax=Salvia splendens TaxID=180675 RepID=A0A8X8VY32_SALSN|nr:hypothetical protein SASPL_155681 [Salvia splendens]